MILNVNNDNIICGPYLKRCVFWFESNQWIPKKRFDPSWCLIEPRIWIYAGSNYNLNLGY